MSARLKEIARQTEAIVAAGRYETPDGRTVLLGPDIAAARAGTRLHGPDPLPVTPDTDRHTAIEVTGEGSTEAARRLTSATAAADTDAPVAVLNFASARNPGGGYLNGARAQEEALCRVSALYTTLLCAPAYYEHHRADRDPFYTDRVIHSPSVPVFRDDSGALLEHPYRVGFLTSPAPNTGVILRRTPEAAARVPGAVAVRAERVLETAVRGGYRRLVLGAWGCGVFQNDPRVVAGAFHDLLTGTGRFAGHFDEVVFAILDRTRTGATMAAFRDRFGGA
ncbi:TIGR02452 family protein [Streptomyces sp. NPDC057638]|uniref:TIGR02452 family protein n=1 Tax=Streptomyces sp. NPDC057638 TaxID=3346190 RepID=UPI003683A2E1